MAIIKKEFSSYFSSPLGYIYLAIFFVFSGIYFFATCLFGVGNTSLSGVFNGMFSIVVFLIPVITMRLWSEEKKQKTDQLLFTAPITLNRIVLGKYIAALIMYFLSVLITIVYGFIISCFASMDWLLVLTNFAGLFLTGAAFISIGMFISALTENQFIAALGSFATGFLIIMLNAIGSLINSNVIRNVFTNLSFSTHYQNFTSGILALGDIVFFLSVCIIFVFLTVRVFEKKRWS